ncbi:flagellin [Halodesulfovibrio aestuarii]|uniref:Flagellin n=1 Tax=Halodesulfovibrio aestuarii TaxID=126333 RepID=A0A8G2C993_9BACT|nr:flagellin [Halodesulfovibrio aestuarii]
MSLIINNNSMANTAARNLNSAYSDLTKSTERLSSGMRINSAADDAAGLAVREMMRAEVTTLNQGIRNANDAISMIQTADGALSVIDEKLIRMNELAEQAATGTYTDEQRVIIDQEYQSMAEEITRISDATDFNGTKLLDGSLNDGVEYLDDDGQLQTGSSMTIHFGTGNDADEDKYAINIEDVSSDSLGIGSGSLDYQINDEGLVTTKDGNAIYENEDGEIYIEGDNPAVTGGPVGYTQVQLKERVVADPTEESGAKTDLEDLVSVPALGTAGAATVDGSSVHGTIDADGNLVYTVDGTANATTDIAVTDSGQLNIGTGASAKSVYTTVGTDGTVSFKTVANAGDPIPEAGTAVEVDSDGNYTVNVGGEDKKLLTSVASDGTTQYYIEDVSENIPDDAAVMNVDRDVVEQNFSVADDGSATLGTVTIQEGGSGYALTAAAAGTGAAAAAFDMTISSVSDDKVTSFEQELGKTDEYAGSSIATQEGAEAALAAIEKAIEIKDKNRANLGAYENRLSATISNLEIQSENLGAAESRISDVDVATEMTEYTLRQTISSAATSMLAQANSLPENALKLISG